MQVEELREAIRQMGRGEGSAWRYAPDALCLAGLETRRPGEGYFWDGLERGATPFLVFQVTLTGEGIYEEPEGQRHRILPGMAFAAVIPSAHRYYLPADAPGSWSFFFILIRHPYVVERFAARQAELGSGGALWNITEENALLTRTLTLFEGAFADRFAEEAALFDFVLAHERAAHVRAIGGTERVTERERLLTDARRYIETHLADSVGVTEMARHFGRERSRFSHEFREVTGQPPAQFMTRVRLEEAARRLARTGDTLEAIAQTTGFADANHLCKVFRRHFHVSPGSYRRQVG